MAERIASLYAEIGANTTGLKAGLAQAQAGLAQAETAAVSLAAAVDSSLSSATSEVSQFAAAVQSTSTSVSSGVDKMSFGMDNLEASIESNLGSARTSFDKLLDGVSSVGTGMSGLAANVQRNTAGFKEAWRTTITPIRDTIEVLGQVGRAAQQAYAFVSEGAQLARTEEQFGALSKSIGTTSDALLGELKRATNGTISDFKLMESATSIMSLGLADTSEETVRLASLVGKLGWDMNQVTLTLANQSTMRLDSLGLSVSDVTGRVDALKASGMSADQAFKFAILEAGEEKVKLLGDAALTAAGKLKILEANSANLKDNLQSTFSQQFITNLNDFSGGLFETADGASAAGKSIGELAADAIAFGLHMRKATDVVEDLTGATGKLSGALRQSKDAVQEERAAVIASLTAYDDRREAIESNAAVTDDAIFAERAFDQQMRAINRTIVEYGGSLTATSEPLDELYYSTHEATTATRELGETIPTVTGYIAKSAEAMDAFSASTGQYFMTAAEAGDSLGFFNENLADLGTSLVATTVSIGDNEADLTLLQDAYDKAAAKVKKYQLGIEGATLSEEERGEKIGELQGQMANYQSQMDGLGASVTTYSQRTIEATVNQDAVNQALVESIAAAGGSAEEIGAAALALGTMSEAQVEAAMKAAELEIRIAGVRQAYLDGRISADDLTTAIGQQIDIVNGMDVSVNTATGSVGLFGDAMTTSADSTQRMLDKIGLFPDEVSTTVNIDTSEAQARIDALLGKLNELGGSRPGEEEEMRGLPPASTGGSGNTSTGGNTHGNIPQYASGADFIVPPGYPNDSYPMRVQSGERVQVTPAGQSSGGNTYNLYVTAMDGGANVAREFNYMKAISNV